MTTIEAKYACETGARMYECRLLQPMPEEGE